jgi:hypothetical protein
MFTAESIRLLAKDQRRQLRTMSDDARKDVTDRAIPNHDAIAHQYYDQNIDGEPGPDTENPVSGDPNDSPDPDDRAALQVQQSNDDGTSSDSITPLSPLPEMPCCSWWSALTFGKEDDTVSPADAETCLRLVRARLQAYQSVQLADEEDHPPSQEAVTARLMVEEGKDSGPPATINALHETIESIGPNAWSVFVELWQEACGIQGPAKNDKSKPTGAPIIAAEPDGKADTLLPPLPERCFPLEEGLHRALPGMPPQVAAFLLHVPRDPPAWRYQESAGERAEREFLEGQGGWTG